MLYLVYKYYVKISLDKGEKMKEVIKKIGLGIKIKILILSLRNIFILLFNA